MLDRLKYHFLKFDWIIFSAVFLLSLFGLIEIYSIALGQETISLFNFKRQIFYVIFGTLTLFATSFIDYNLIKSLNKYIYIFGVILLVAVLFLGDTQRGTTGWFNIFGFNFQPVEFIKIVLIVFLANFFSKSTFKNRPLKNLILSFSGMFILVFLVLRQPDFGSAMIMVVLWFLMLILAGFDKKYLLLIIIPFFLIAFLSWNFYLGDYQKGRILTLISPGSDSLGKDYNVLQALIAVGSGGLTGRGVGFGSQSQLKFLPEAQNDFIFSVISEEFGFFGSSLVLFIYFVLLLRLLFLLRGMKNDFAIFFILGSMVLIFIEMFINIGMNIGIVPVVGISLPFVSYGGSATLANFVLIGIIQSIIIKSKS